VLGLADHFHFTPIAGEIESWKMERNMIEHALGLAETAPESSGYVGDSYFWREEGEPEPGADRSGYPVPRGGVPVDRAPGRFIFLNVL